MFSPYYARARRRGEADPLAHCALNIALYGPHRRWALTERGAAAVTRTPTALAIGPSSLAWEGDALVLRFDETTAPLPTRVRGVVRLHPAAPLHHAVRLDAEGRHRWWPVAPCGRVEVALSQPALRWRGTGYVDANAGDVALERAFRSWTWSSARLRRGTAVLYDVVRRGGDSLSLALLFDRRGDVVPFAPPPVAPLPRTGWGIARSTRSEAGCPARVVRTLEDTPFYARSLVSTQLAGEAAPAIHESLSLERFAAPWVQWLLPFRMARAR